MITFLLTLSGCASLVVAGAHLNSNDRRDRIVGAIVALMATLAFVLGVST